MRLRKKPHTDEKLLQFDFVIRDANVDYKGKWRDLFGNSNPLHVEFGTGKGDFITQIASLNPNVNYLGIDVEPAVILPAARKVAANNLPNVKLLIFDINRISEIFGDNEIDRIYINFCDPWPKKRHAKRRLTHINFLDMYKAILGGDIHFKTDNRGLFDFSLEQFEIAGLNVSNVSYDLHADEPPDNIRTEYENRFSAIGTPIHRCVVSKK